MPKNATELRIDRRFARTTGVVSPVVGSGGSGGSGMVVHELGGSWHSITQPLDMQGEAITNVGLVDGVDISTLVAGGIDHGTLSGLADDDHTQYVHNTIARSITAQHTFAPASAQAPFVLSANAQGVVVTGFRADQLNRNISPGDGLSGGGLLTADRTLSVDSTVLRTNTNQSITAQHSFAPASAQAPFTLTANAQGVAVVGFRADQLNRNIIAGDGLTGGGLLTTDRTLAVDGTILRTTRILTAGAGLTGGGDLSADRTFDVGTGDGITVNADDVAVNATVLRTNTPQTITVQHTFNPSSTNAPFILGANATGVLVTGLNADLLDGLDQSVFMRKSADSDLDMNQFDITDVDAVAANTGAFISTANAALVVGTTATGHARVGHTTLSYASNSFSLSSGSVGATIGISSSFALLDINCLTIELGQPSGGTTNFFGNSITATNWTISAAGEANFASNVDTIHYLGRAQVGNSSLSNRATFGHLNVATATGYGVTQDTAGTTIVNGESGQRVYLRVGDAQGVYYDGARFAPEVSYTKDLGNYNQKFRTLFVAEMYVETLVAQDVMSTIGGRIMVSPTTTLIADIDDTQTTFDVKHNNLRNGEFVVLITAPGGVPQFEAIKIVSGATTITGGFRYTIERAKDGTAANEWLEGDAVASLQKNAGEGFIELTATNTVYQHLGPNITIYARTGTTNWNDSVPVVSMGNLDSWVGYGTEFGFAVGNNLTLTPTTGFKGVTADRTNGIRLFSVDLEMYTGSTQTVDLDSADGSLQLGTDLASNTTTSFVFDGTTGALRLGPQGSGKPNLYWSGTALQVRNNTTAIFQVNSSGELVIANDVSLTPSTGLKGIIADNTNGLRLYNVDIDLYAGSSKIASLNDDFGLEFQNYQSSPSDSKRKLSWWNDITSRSEADASQIWSQAFSNDRALILNANTTASGTTPRISLAATNSGTSKAARINLNAGNNTGQINQITLQAENFTLSGDGIDTNVTIVGDLDMDGNAIDAVLSLQAATVKARTSSGLHIEDDGANLGIFVEDGGDVGVGTATVPAKLTVAGSIYSLASATDTVFSGTVGNNNANYIGTGGFWAIRTSTNDRFNIDVYNGGSPINAMQVEQDGDAWFVGNVSALSFTDRTPYPETLEQAVEAILSHSRLADYDAGDKAHQLDHAKLHPFVRSGEYRDLSATVSALIEVMREYVLKGESHGSRN